MDYLYMSDVISYVKSRNYLDDSQDYTKKNGNETNNYGYKKQCNKQQKNDYEKPTSKHNCKMCQEKQRRSLLKYIQQKSQRCKATCIAEDDENEASDAKCSRNGNK